MKKFIVCTNDIVWGAPALFLILSVGLYLSCRLGFVQILCFPKALRHFLRQFLPGSKEEEPSSFQALCTALAATVGTGNLVGVAGAICLGGPGAVFWMWICGILGMATKYAEAVLAVRYRKKTPDGYAGGPMYIITQGLPSRLRFLAYLYAAFGMIASFGVGNVTQIHAAVNGIREACGNFGWVPGRESDLLISFGFALILAASLRGGAKRITSVAGQLIPLAAAGYILLCFGVLAGNWDKIPDAFLRIFQGAFSPRAVTGGMLGSGFRALRVGCSRGVFTNEAGMGTASIAHAGARGVHPVEQGFMGIMEVFLDTLLICTLTALVILVSGVPVPYGLEEGGKLTSGAFSVVYGKAASVWLAVSMVLFALATVIGWGLYGVRCGEFLFGSRVWAYFPVLQMLISVSGSFLETSTVWQLAEAVNGLMAIPNLIMLAALAPEVVRLTKDYKNTGISSAGGGIYADFHQCKPL